MRRLVRNCQNYLVPNVEIGQCWNWVQTQVQVASIKVFCVGSVSCYLKAVNDHISIIHSLLCCDRQHYPAWCANIHCLWKWKLYWMYSGLLLGLKRLHFLACRLTFILSVNQAVITYSVHMLTTCLILATYLYLYYIPHTLPHDNTHIDAQSPEHLSHWKW